MQKMNGCFVKGGGRSGGKCRAALKFRKPKMRYLPEDRRKELSGEAKYNGAADIMVDKQGMIRVT